jgi:hypothetical protein
MDRLGTLRFYVGSMIFTVVVLTLIGVIKGGDGLGITAELAVLEISLSFDNAVVNAIKLRLLNSFWQQMFIYVGIFVAVGVVRFLLPILIVMGTAGLGFTKVLDLAVNHPHDYSAQLDSAHVAVAMVGGIFLLMIFLNNMIGGENDEQWIGIFERPLARLGKYTYLARTIALAVIVVIWAAQDWNKVVPIAGLISLAVFEIVGAIGNKLEDDEEEEVADQPKGQPKIKAAGLASFGVFLYLEVQDAMFSFDGVSGAFALSSDVFIIMAGLAIGAMFIRSMTVHFVRTNKLGEFRYLGNGAMWAIGTLAVFILISTQTDIPNWLTGLIGVFFIVSAWIHSVIENRRDARQEANTVSKLQQLNA